MFLFSATATVFTTLLAALAGLTLRVMTAILLALGAGGGVSPEPGRSAAKVLVQVTTSGFVPVWPQAQPVPPLPAGTNRMLAGKLSVTVTRVPRGNLAVPTFETVTANEQLLLPEVHGALTDSV